jgi:predicted homoserine dehydrogenase-like protein
MMINQPPKRMNNDDGFKETACEQIQVECYSGYKVNEYPIAFTFQGRRWDISEVVDRWYEGGISPDKSVVDYFKVKTNDGSVFILRYVSDTDIWSIRIQQ